MVSDLDIYRTAQIIIDQYGESAIIEAARRQDKLLTSGDLNGAKVWSRIGDAIEFLQMSADIAGAVIH